MEKGHDIQVQAAPVPSPFPVDGANPGPRCGHTLTVIIGADGDLSKAKLVMFGGATALEGPDGGSQPAATAAGIRLAGATNDVHIMEFRTGKWTKIEPLGELPAPRAAHAAAAVGSMMVVQGGIGPAGLASEDLHVLDFSNPDQPRWHRVFVNGQGPSARYAHTLALVANRFIVAMGGNDGRNTLADAWALDTSEKPYQWRKVTATGLMPPARMYATAAARQDGLLLLCGGRSEKGQPLNDAYGLARHRDGRWEWAAAPNAMPAGRYQHAAVFVGARLHVSGGSLGGGKMVEKKDSVLILDSTAGVWASPAKRDGSEDLSRRCRQKPDLYRSVHAGSADPSRRCRHAVAAVGPYIFVYGGLMGSTLHADLLLADDGGMKDVATYDPRSTPWMKWLESDNQAAQMLAHNAAEEAAAASTLIVHRVDTNADMVTEEVKPPTVPAPDTGAGKELAFAGHTPHTGEGEDNGEVQVRLFHRAVVVANNQSGSMRGIVLQLSIDQFENESRRMATTGVPMTTTPHRVMLNDPARASSMFAVTASDVSIHRRVIAELLRPRDWKPPEDRAFFLRGKEVNELCSMVEVVLQQEPTVLKLNAPIKIFGDLHGQFGDLMRLFEEYGVPSTAGDITYIDYLFLGDYVDRGAYSLETICLLLALKIEHPRSIHLLRGNHEAADINALFGFRMECMERMGEYGVFIWQRINQVFNWLPLAAHIEGKILCMHGGIGRSINQIKQIEVLSRPLTMEQGGVVLMDLLWSDPTTNDAVQGVRPSPRGPGLVTFGPDRVKDFCKMNSLQIIVRAHECVMDGFERFAQGHLITLFSATNYCGTANNAGAILVLGRDLVMVPKLIHPLPPTTPQSPGMMGGGGEEGVHLDSWMQTINDERPPTPPRGRPDLTGDAPSLGYF